MNAPMRSEARRQRAPFWLTLAAVILVGDAAALSTDSEQPIEIEADFAELDEQAGRTVYRGNVELRQGSLHMKGEKLEVLFDTNQDLEEVHLTGEPAWFKQTPDDSLTDIEGEALTIDYRRDDNLLKLIDEARLTRGEQLFEGNEIDYDTERSLIRARAKTVPADPGKASEQPAGGRVRIVIPPKKNPPPTQ